MGSRLSPGLANIFCHMMEKQIIEKYLNNEIAMYKRYVDDIFCIIKKGEAERILNEMNNFNPSLKFTIEKMVKNKLIFLDTVVYMNSDNVLQLKKYNKQTASDVVLNFSKSVTPLKYKISTLIGEIYRCNNTTTNEKDLK